VRDKLIKAPVPSPANAVPSPSPRCSLRCTPWLPGGLDTRPADHPGPVRRGYPGRKLLTVAEHHRNRQRVAVLSGWGSEQGVNLAQNCSIILRNVVGVPFVGCALLHPPPRAPRNVHCLGDSPPAKYEFCAILPPPGVRPGCSARTYILRRVRGCRLGGFTPARRAPPTVCGRGEIVCLRREIAPHPPRLRRPPP
jgi:hypothetical protein